MTYGEARVFAKENWEIKNGIAVISVPEHKSRKNFTEACRYYNQKLKKYWEEKKRERSLEKKPFVLTCFYAEQTLTKYKRQRC